MALTIDRLRPAQGTAGRFWRSATQVVLGGIGVAGLAYVCYRLGLDVATTALLDLIAIVLLSLGGNFASSAVVAVVATLCLHYLFTPPLLSLRMADLRDLVALVAFLTTALVVTRLLSRVRQSLREVQRASDRLQLAIDTIPALVWTTLPDGSSEFNNQRWLEYTGLSREAAREWGYKSAIHPEDFERLRDKWAASFASGEPIEDEARLRRADGEHRWFLHRAVPLREESGRIATWYGTSTDIEDLKRAGRAVRRARQRVLEARFAAVVDERTRLAREMHDTLLQGFTGVALQLVAAANRVTGPPEAIAGLGDVVSLAQKTLEDARRAVWDLRAPASASADFPAAVRTVAEDGIRHTGLTLDCQVGGVPRPVEPDVEAVVLRVLQEAVTNIVKHAAARTVRVKLSFGSRGVRLSVSDDGRGFVVDPDFRAYGGHWGLLGMRERASQVHGTLRMRSNPEEGTEIVLLVPYAVRRGSPG
jgi:PAS domain S-box-containing protein